MPITVQWDNNEKTIILWVFKSLCPREAIETAHKTEKALVQSVQHPVGVIVDWHHGSPFTGGMDLKLYVGDYEPSETQNPPSESRRAAIRVMVERKALADAANASIHLLADKLINNTPTVRFTSDLDDARQIILEYLKNNSE
jgi:hypothetical protein